MKPIADAVLLNARQEVAAARKKVVESGLALVAIRRTAGLVVFWYAFETRHVLTCFEAHDDKTTVLEALDLHEHTAAPVADPSTMATEAPDANTVILDGARFVGVQLASAPPDLGIDGNLQEAALPPSPGPIQRATRRTGIAIERSRRMQRRFRSPPPVADGPGVEESVEMAREPEQASTRDALASVPPASEDTTPFTAYPRLDVPARVASRERFTVTIGLAARLVSGTSGRPVTIDLPSHVEHFALSVLVIAEGFGMPEGGRHCLEVDRSDPFAHSIRVPMIAPDVESDALLTTISVVYFFENVPCGTVARRIAVAPAGTDLFAYVGASGELWTSGGERRGPITVQAGVPPIDLTVTISKPDGDPTSGRFVWTFESPHDVALPAEPVARDLGTDAHELGARIIEGIQSSEAQNMVKLEIGGLGKTIADRMPTEFQRLLREVGKAVDAGTPGRPPTVLFLTAEAHVPWELALLDPPLDAGAPPYLGCQTNMARWPLSDTGTPSLPPASSIDVYHLAVVVGDYAARSGWRKLEKAEHEGRTIEVRYGATRLNAEAPQIKKLLYADMELAEGVGGVEAVHFACHGEAIRNHVLDAAVILGDGQRMASTWFANAPLGKEHQPFLFLNACQVGKAGELLGSFSGFAGDSLKGGFRGFLAPLWSVDDGLACDMALEFYDRAFGTGGRNPEPVGAILRSMRGRFAPDTEKKSATRLAYVFYGHPSLTLHRKEED